MLCPSHDSWECCRYAGNTYAYKLTEIDVMQIRATKCNNSQGKIDDEFIKKTSHYADP